MVYVTLNKDTYLTLDPLPLSYSVTQQTDHITEDSFHHLFTDLRTNQLTSLEFCCLHWKHVSFKFKLVSTDDVFDVQSKSLRLLVLIQIQWKSSPTKCSDGTSPTTISFSVESRMFSRKSWSKSTTARKKCAVN